MKKLKLKYLLSKITPNNIYPEINSGVAVGKEILDPYIREKVDREI